MSMTNNDINAVLAVFLTLIAAATFAVWISPHALYRLALVCVVRAKSLEASRQAYAETKRIALEEGL
jgi:hypothetical protein